MAFQVADRVKETTTTTGTGTLDLGGAASGFETFVAGIGNGNETYYVITDPNTGDYEVGVGTITDAATDTLSRDSVITSSNAGSLVNFGAGTKDVFCSLPSERAVIIDDASNVEVTANITATSFDGSGAALTSLNASNVSSGTLPNARLDAQLQDIAGLATTSGKIIQGDGANFVLSSYTIPTSDGTTGQVLTTNGSGAVTFQTPTVGDITAVTAGDGLTGGGTTGAVTLNVGAGTGIDVAADTVSVDVSDFMTNGSNNRVLTATGTDAMNAETNMTFDGSTLAVTGGATFTANVSLGDNDYLRFGAGNDLLIYHDGSNSYVQDTGTGSLLLRGTNLSLQANNGENFINCTENGSVLIRHNNLGKLETTSTGVTVTGTVTATAFSGDGSALTGISGGKIGQVVIGERTAQTSLGTGSFVDLNLSQSITPTSTSSKILILGSIMGCQVDTGANSRLDIRLQRDIAGGGYSQISATSGANYFRTGTTLSFRAGGFSFNFIDSPSSTGSVTYKFQGQGVDCSVSGAFTNKDGNAGRSNIILLEILP